MSSLPARGVAARAVLRSIAGHRDVRSKVTVEPVVPNLLNGLLYSSWMVVGKWAYDIMWLFKERFV